MGAWIEIRLLAPVIRDIRSHPTMGAWIEIYLQRLTFVLTWVAPHDGCVDWNSKGICTSIGYFLSHPTMGAWIEIQVVCKTCTRLVVAPHDGCVDWNTNLFLWFIQGWCRTPRWVRGLKSLYLISLFKRSKSHPTMGAWIEIVLRLPFLS